MYTVSSPSLLDDLSSLDSLLGTEGWQTLMTFTRESARKCTSPNRFKFTFSIVAQPPSSAPPDSTSRMDEDIPQEVLDQIAAEEAASRSAGGNAGTRICPHCTFENTHAGSDCEVCGLPL